MRFTAHVLNTFYCRGALGTGVNPDNIECMWTGEFDLTTRRVDEEMKKLRIQKYPDTHGQGLKHIKDATNFDIY